MKLLTLIVALPVTLAAAYGGATVFHSLHMHASELVALFIGLVVFMLLCLMIIEETK